MWDAQTGQELHTFDSRVVAGTAVFSPDAKRLASASDTEKTVKVWDAETGQELLSLKRWQHCLRSRQRGLSARTANAWRAFQRGMVKVWDAQTGQELSCPQGRGASVAFSPDGKRLATGSGTWDATKKAFVAGEVQGVGRPDRSANPHPQGAHRRGPGSGLQPGRQAPGQRLPVQRPAEVKVWDAQTGQELLNLKEPSDGFDTIAFSPDGKSLRYRRRQFDQGVGRPNWPGHLELQGHTSSVRGLAFSPDSQRLASSSSDQTLRVWDLQSGKEISMLKGLPATPFINNRKFFSPDSTRLAIVNAMEVKIWAWDAHKKPDPQKLSLKGISRQSSISTGDSAGSD